MFHENLGSLFQLLADRSETAATSTVASATTITSACGSRVVLIIGGQPSVRAFSRLSCLHCSIKFIPVVYSVSGAFLSKVLAGSQLL